MSAASAPGFIVGVAMYQVGEPINAPARSGSEFICGSQYNASVVGVAFCDVSTAWPETLWSRKSMSMPLPPTCTVVAETVKVPVKSSACGALGPEGVVVVGGLVVTVVPPGPLTPVVVVESPSVVVVDSSDVVSLDAGCRVPTTTPLSLEAVAHAVARTRPRCTIVVRR